MTATHGTHLIEPVELFLRNIVCNERLALYQMVIDTIKIAEKGSLIESLNSIVSRDSDESPAELMNIIHGTMIRHLTEMMVEFDIVTTTSDLEFLCTLYKTVSILDNYEAHDTIVDIIENAESDPRYTLYQVLNVVQYFDEFEFFDGVFMCSMSFIDNLKQIHQTALDRLEDEELVASEVDLTLLKKVAQENNDLILNRLLEDGKINNVMDAKHLTQIAKVEFETYEETNPKHVAKEMIALYLATGLQSEDLFNVIKENIHELISDDYVITQTNIAIPNIYMEMSS